MIKNPRPGRLTQGSVFCGADAEDYITEPVWGAIITARCDTAHEKVPVLNYLPIVRVTDWLHVHGALIVFDRVHNALIERFKS